jgi:tetratricopeptide (TPR) repeat protein
VIEAMRVDATLVLNPTTPGDVLDATTDSAPSVRQSPLPGPDGRKRLFLGSGITGAALIAILIGSQLLSELETGASESTYAKPESPEIGSVIAENTTEQRRIHEEAERQVREKQERQAREEAARRVREKQERQAREEAERRVREKQERQARKEKIDVLVRNAETALAEYRLTTPEADSAYGYYHQVLALDPKNPDARQGLLVIADTYYKLARKAESSWDYDRANRYVDSGLKVKPKYERLLELRKFLAEEHITKRTIKKSLKGMKGLFD